MFIEPVRDLRLGGLQVADRLAAGGEEGAVFEAGEQAVDLGGREAGGYEGF